MASSSIQALYRSRQKMVHESAPIGYAPNPAHNPAFPVSAMNPLETPFVIRLGKEGTYNVGRNKAKREARASAAVGA